ncbi:sugar phosphate isomerase/epimerase family protein [Sporolactobacillus terrae]|uniref:Sugar phosphate isomerase/epimerase n=1 Tax=Sporolactobacillus terrae TaxID=269673 RepID=A0ABX5Q5H7_9BACL|nr:sugar phosphate isomerase/epimerase [Sporolactobacillus terrae]QAA21854.1 sugar phosphate isomerase/epimerase [Sporolactobacillus terrae]QAA24827.1 sugar phosphate isomerase/epimerase [Sporolactobacillus terrae]
MRALFLNTLIFQKDLQAKKKRQSELFQTAKALGVSGIEVRREYFFENGSLNWKELKRCGQEAERTGLRVFYSIPEKLFVNGTCSPHLEEYLKEAALLHAESAKLNIGEPGEINEAQCEQLERLICNYSVQITIENDQTEENGQLKFVSAALESLKDSLIGYTFDSGNWLWQGIDPFEAARHVGNAITIFHLKDVATKGGLHTVLLGQGTIDWKKVLAECSDDVPVVIEYPIDTCDDLKDELAKIRTVLSERKEGAKS